MFAFFIKEKTHAAVQFCIVPLCTAENGVLLFLGTLANSTCILCN